MLEVVDRGGLMKWLVEAGLLQWTSINHQDQPRSTTSSLTVAGFGFRTIGRLV
jgi:hypothetical protein